MTVSINGTSGLVFNDASTQNTAATGFGFKNRIINGAMVISQRGTSAFTINDAASYTVDRWFGEDVTDGAFTVQQDSSAPTGFSFSAKVTVTTADASLAAGQYAVFTQRIEGFNTADLGWGASGAATVTLSFWVRSSLTGTFGGVLANSAENYSYPFTYTISAANTWEQKSITVAGATAGTWVGATNGKGMIVTFGLGSGSTYVGTAGAWAAADYRGGATGQTNILGTLSATWQVTGVQLEKGSTATSFDYRPYGTELALCQRYYQLAGTGVTGIGNGTTTSLAIKHTVQMRVQPSVGQSAILRISDITTSAYSQTSTSVVIDGSWSNIYGTWVQAANFSPSVPSNRPVFLTSDGSGAAGVIQLSAEL
jgi:hypothetical protein